ncbi:hypothetical protein AQUCO_00900761v1, partial [Aquilegia coerulea]
VLLHSHELMDLNVVPEDHEDEIFRGHYDQEPRSREQEDRRRGFKRDYPGEGSNHGGGHYYRGGQGYHHNNNKHSRPYDRNKLPEGWLGCPAYGQNIDYIIPSKVPLGDNFIIHGKRYSCRDAVHEQGKLRREIGLVIDLTNTSRYYPTSDWKKIKAGTRHVKIACKGRGSVPDNESVNDFIYEVSQFYSSQKQSNRKYILVHCTHGFNRTGYMIVHFLVRSQSVSVTEALQRFANARPPGIYKQDYIDELYTFYGERRPEIIECPLTPEWKRSSEFDLNGKMMQDEDSGSSSVHEVLENKEMTNDDVIGDALPYDENDMMQQCCYDLLGQGRRAKGNMQFPGSHPVSLNRDNLQLLRQRYYYATWKADGTRYMMLITWDGCYLIDRKFCFRRVRVRFPLKQNNEGFDKETHNITLLDGEMVIETLPDTQKQVRRYLIYDVMAINGVPVVELPFCERWKRLEREVIEPRNLERRFFDQSRIPYYRYDMEPFRVRRKDFWLLSVVTKLLENFIPKLSHEADGLIFQGWDDPYVLRTHEGLLKWKYSDTIDFLFEVTDDYRQLLILNEGRKKRVVEGSVLFEKSDPSAFNGKIIECSWDANKQVWVYMRTRTDKSNPNEFNTYRKVIVHNLLINFLEGILKYVY